MLSTADKISTAQQLKAEGNDAFKAGDYKLAVSKYSKIYAYVDGIKSPKMGMEAVLAQSRTAPVNELSAEEGTVIDALLLNASNNLAASYLRLDDGERALKFATKSLTFQEGNVKGLFRQGQAYLLLNDLERARASLTQAQQLCPNDKNIRASLQTLATREREERQADAAAQKAMYAGMFDSGKSKQ